MAISNLKMAQSPEKDQQIQMQEYYGEHYSKHVKLPCYLEFEKYKVVCHFLVIC